MPQPGTAEPAWLTDGFDHIWLPYAQMKTAPRPLPVVASCGSRLMLDDGRVLIDGIASWWTACHGYNHPHIAAALTAQLSQMPHVMFGGLAHEQAYKLASRLSALLPGDLERVFFTESGSVSVEVAMKMALQYWMNKGVAGRLKFLSFRGGYHGDTFATMAVCDPDEGMHRQFAGALAQQVIADLPRDAASLAALRDLIARHRNELAAIIIEPRVQGAGGMIFHADDVLRHLRALADEFDLLLIFDEIFTGFGRTGALFACAAAGIVPDIVTLSKALTGGTLPLAATIARKHIFDAFLDDDAGKALMHGPTYMGNALACAAANASLDLFERESRLQQVAEISAGLEQGLNPCKSLPGVKDVRIMGAIGVVELTQIRDRRILQRAFIDKGVWVRPFGNIVYLTPAFTISADELGQITSAICDVLSA